MNPMEARLREIAAELGEHSPANTYFQDLLGLSSGRITQLFDAGANSKLGAASLSRLVAKGYNPDWVQHGPPHKKLIRAPGNDPAPVKADALTAAIMARVLALTTEQQAKLLTDLIATADPPAIKKRGLSG